MNDVSYVFTPAGHFFLTTSVQFLVYANIVLLNHMGETTFRHLDVVKPAEVKTLYRIGQEMKHYLRVSNTNLEEFKNTVL